MATDTLTPERIVVDHVWSAFDQRATCLREESRRPLDTRRAGALILDALLLAPVTALLFFNDMVLVAAALSLSYFFVCESLWGQTLGKRAAGLRVVRLDGRPLTIASAAARNLFLPIDALPGAYLLGSLLMICTRHRQRLGDIVAGTVVTWADMYPHLPAQERARPALLVGYPAMWLATAALATAILSGSESGLRVYRAEVSRVCASAAAGIRTPQEAITALDQMQASLQNVQPPAGMRRTHAALVAAMVQLHRDAAAVGAARTPVGHQLRVARMQNDELAMRRDFAGLGLDACL